VTRYGWRHLHPLLLAAYPVLLLYSANVLYLGLTVVVRPLAASLVLAFIVYLLSLAVLRNADKAAMVASSLIFLFFSFGWFWLALQNLAQAGISRPVVLALYFSLAVVLIWSIVKSHLRFTRVNRVLTVFTVVLMVLVSLEIGYNEIGRARAHADLLRDRCIEFAAGRVNPETTPDVYYIVLDRYASADVLEDAYGFDNSRFLGQLEKLGFHVDRASRANYPVTMESIAATMNMQYIDWLKGRARDWSPLYQMIQDSCVLRLFESLGYTYVHFGSPWGPTRTNSKAIRNVPRTLLSEFEQVVLSTTILSGIEFRLIPRDGTAKYARVMCQLEELPRVADMAEPTFAFAHMLVPHPPYVFGADGSFRGLEEAEQRTTKNFVDQLFFINARILSVITEIMDHSEVPPIIVIQADEGPYPRSYDAGGAEFDWTSGSDEELRHKMGIFSAYLIPDTPEDVFYEGMTPVNSFRLIFRYGLGLPFSLLDDHSYVFRDKAHPYEFVDVTERISR